MSYFCLLSQHKDQGYSCCLVGDQSRRLQVHRCACFKCVLSAAVSILPWGPNCFHSYAIAVHWQQYVALPSRSVYHDLMWMQHLRRGGWCMQANRHGRRALLDPLGTIRFLNTKTHLSISYTSLLPQQLVTSGPAFVIGVTFFLVKR